MRTKISFLTVIFLFLLGCDSSQSLRETVNQVEADSDTKENLNIQLNHFSEIDSSGILIFPLGMGQSKNIVEEYTYKKIPEMNFWNMVFFNSNTNEYHLLTEEKILFSSYEFQNFSYNINGANPNNRDYIFYLAKSIDYNQDSLLNDKDPLQLYVSDKFGKKFRIISPPQGNLYEWEYIPKSNKVVMLIQEDTNKDKFFDEREEILTYEVTLGENETPQAVFNKDFKQELKKLYARDWKRID